MLDVTDRRLCPARLGLPQTSYITDHRPWPARSGLPPDTCWPLILCHRLDQATIRPLRLPVRWPLAGIHPLRAARHPPLVMLSAISSTYHI
jgi:hypothetical protein